jgi:CheY-like chemotaxis protein
MYPARILLVDNYRDALVTWAFFLRTRGYEVITASDGIAATQIAMDMQPDLIVMDLELPGLSGCDAARRIRAALAPAPVPIIATTSNTHPAHLDEAHAVGFFRLMVKPCDPPRFLREIDRALSASVTLAGRRPAVAAPATAASHAD